MHSRLIVFSLACTLAFVVAQLQLRVTAAASSSSAAAATSSTDQTLEHGAVGSSVVEASIAKIRATCIFGDDKLFLRRLAYLMTKDGYDSIAARSGGIWEITKTQFKQTQQNESYFAQISSNFSIDWRATTYEDLQKPLLSALAAWMTILRHEPSIPWDIDKQAYLWQRIFDQTGTKMTFVKAAKLLNQVHDSKTDVIFLLDGSGSIRTINFNLMTDFVQSFVGGYEIGHNSSHVGVVVFATSTKVEVPLNNNFAKDQLLTKIKEIQQPKSLTGTSKGLQEVNDMFTSHGRADVPKVAIIVTDGMSNNNAETLREAKRLKDDHVTLIAIGVGTGVRKSELDGMASSPICTHVYQLGDFRELTSLRSVLLREAHQAPVFFPQEMPVSVTLQPGMEQKCNFKIPADEAAVEIAVDKGHISFFLSADDYPNAAKYEQKMDVSGGQVKVLTNITNNNGESGDAMRYCMMVNDASVPVNVTATVLKPAEFRLAGGDDNGGRVEVKSNGIWGTICGDKWNDKNAKVICRMLNKNGGKAVLLQDTVFGEGKGPVWANDESCTGQDDDIAFCRDTKWNQGNCDHTQDAAVLCMDENPCDIHPCENEGICKVDGSGSQCRCKKGFIGERCQTNNSEAHLLDINLRGDSGRVELTTTTGHARGKGLKLAICVHRASLDNQTADQENIAKVVCRQLGKGVGQVEVGYRGYAENFVLEDVSCTGSEANIGLCQFKWLSSCPSESRLAIRCGSGKEFCSTFTQDCIQHLNHHFKSVCPSF